jgi:CRP-like cAMP-binding protein
MSAGDRPASCQSSVTPVRHNENVKTRSIQAAHTVRQAVGPSLLSWCRLLSSAGSETILPAGCRLTDEHRPGRYCFLLLDGSAESWAGGHLLATFSAGSFVGSLDDHGRPSPLLGITVRVIEPAHALVLDTRKLAALLDCDRVLAAAWLRHKPADRPLYGKHRPCDQRTLVR